MALAVLVEVRLATAVGVMVVRVVQDHRPVIEHEQVAAVRPRQHVRIEHQRRRAMAMIRRLSATTVPKCSAAAARSWVVATTVLPAAASSARQAHQVLLGGRRRRRSPARRAGRGRAPRRWRAPGRLDAAGHRTVRRSASRGDRPCPPAPAPSRPPRDRRRRGDAGPELRIATHHHHVPDAHRERPVDHLGLRHVRHASGFLPGRRTQHLDGAAPRPDEAGDDLQQRLLAAAVRAEDGHQRAASDAEAHVFERLAAVVAGADAGQPDRVAGRGARRRRRTARWSEPVSGRSSKRLDESGRCPSGSAARSWSRAGLRG